MTWWLSITNPIGWRGFVLVDSNDSTDKGLQRAIRKASSLPSVSKINLVEVLSAYITIEMIPDLYLLEFIRLPRLALLGLDDMAKLGPYGMVKVKAAPDIPIRPFRL